MAAKSKNKSFMPGSTWDVIKKVVRAYHAAADQDDPSGVDLSELSGLARPVISTNTNFLREIGILRQDTFKLTETGSRFAMGMEMNDETMTRAALQVAVQESSQIRDLLSMLRARGPMRVQSFKSEIMLKVGLSKESWQAPYIKTLLDFLGEARLIEIRADDTVAVVAVGAETQKRVEDRIELSDSASKSIENPKQPVSGTPGRLAPLPLPLGPNRLAFIELPADWNKKELRKLIKLLEISLGDDDEVAKS
jgi:hypothetical protein